MRVCFLVSEIFAWGKYGGYGSITRSITGGLAEKGIDVLVIVPLRKGQKRVETLDGIKVIGLPYWELVRPPIYKRVNADIFHSLEASILSFISLVTMPSKKHIVTSIDPWNFKDWQLELSYDLRSNPARGLIYPLLWLFYGSPFVKQSVSKMEKVYCQAKYLIPKTQEYFSLPQKPKFLPNPYRIPEYPSRKAKIPTVCYLARWDARKRPEIFFELAKRFPSVRFIAMGKAHDLVVDESLRKKYSSIPNLEMTGFINSFKSDEVNNILDRSWIMINTAAREGLPAAYVESAAHSCAILSSVNSDGFASRGGFHVKNQLSKDMPESLGGMKTSIEDYIEGLDWLLSNDRWRLKGKEGFAYVSKVHEYNKVIEKHLSIYNDLIRS